MTRFAELVVFCVPIYIAGAALHFGRLASDTRKDDHLHGITLVVFGVVSMLGWWLLLPVMFVHQWRHSR